MNKKLLALPLTLILCLGFTLPGLLLMPVRAEDDIVIIREERYNDFFETREDLRKSINMSYSTSEYVSSPGSAKFWFSSPTPVGRLFQTDPIGNLKLYQFYSTMTISFSINFQVGVMASPLKFAWLDAVIWQVNLGKLQATVAGRTCTFPISPGDKEWHNIDTIYNPSTQEIEGLYVDGENSNCIFPIPQGIQLIENFHIGDISHVGSGSPAIFYVDDVVLRTGAYISLPPNGNGNGANPLDDLLAWLRTLPTWVWILFLILAIALVANKMKT